MKFILGVLLGAGLIFYYLTGSFGLSTPETTTEDKITAYYANSAAALVSPHNLRERMAHGTDNYVLIDVRAAEDYEREHIVTAINIDTGESEDRTLDDILREFKDVIADNPDKEIIIYCYSAACMNGRKAGNFLAENGVYVKELTIGWNEWRYGWEMWNYDTEWDTYKVEDFVVHGNEPGMVPERIRSLKPCGVEGALGC